MRRVGWLDLSCGVSGDMLLGAVVSAGVGLDVVAGAVAALGLPVRLTSAAVTRAGLAATKVDVLAAGAGGAGAAVPLDRARGTVGAGGAAGRGGAVGADGVRRWRDIRRLLADAPLAPGVRDRALATFAALAEAEGRVHAVPPDEVHFHEVGALDALADVVGVAAGLDALALDRLTAGPIALGGGTVEATHGVLPVPGPAVLELLRAASAPGHGGPVDVELCTPTGAALVTASADGYGPLPAIVADTVGVGAGSRDLPGRPNVARLVVGWATDEATGPGDSPNEQPDGDILLEANIDDLDPRAWPEILAALLAGGASDAWLTPILMKKGRPAHTLSVLLPRARAAEARRLVFLHTPTLGLRETPVVKRALARRFVRVDVDGHGIAVKVGFLPDGTVTTSQPEWSDVRLAAEALGRPARQVLAQAAAAALATGADPAHDPRRTPDARKGDDQEDRTDRETDTHGKHRE